MKVLINKLKKANKAFLIIYIVTFIIYLISYIMLTHNLINLTGIETVIRFVVISLFGIWLMTYMIWNLINLILKRHITIAITTALTIILVVLFSFVNYYINVIYTGIGNLRESEYVTYTSNLIVLKDTKLNNDSKLGMINSADDIEGNILAKELIQNENLEDLEVIAYSSYYEMIYDLLNNEIDGIFLNSNYKTIYDSDDFKEKIKDVRVILVCPERDNFEEYKERFRARGNSEKFIERRKNEFNTLMNIFDSANEYEKVIVKPGRYLSDTLLEYGINLNPINNEKTYKKIQVKNGNIK